jgi:thiol peroxidase
MAQITLKGNAVKTEGDLPKVGTTAPDFTYVKNDLSETNLYSVKAKFKVLNIFPSIDTGTCAMSVRQFNQKAASMANTAVLNLSLDLPFAQKRFCGAEGIDKVETGSVFRSNFLSNYKIKIMNGGLTGLCSRCVVVLDENNKVLYTEQVSEIANEPNYDLALKAFLK